MQDDYDEPDTDERGQRTRPMILDRLPVGYPLHVEREPNPEAATLHQLALLGDRTLRRERSRSRRSPRRAPCGRAPRLRTNQRRRGSRRGTTTRAPPGDDDPPDDEHVLDRHRLRGGVVA
jgi:hypothetical protein